MKIAIHNSEDDFSKQWILICKRRNIPFKLVNAYDSNIVNHVSDCNAFMWHHSHGDYRDVLFAKQLLYSLEVSGKRVFPDFHTGWHFDDKVGEKYLLEAIGAPLVPTYVFYTKEEAYSWIKKTSFPKVFKLRGGAGASNVRLIHNEYEAKRIVKKAFGKGFPQFDKWNYLKERWQKWRYGKDNFIGVCKGLGRLFITTKFSKMHAPEKGYVYFQDFIPNNSTDFRVKVVNGRCWAFQRKVRKNDFRASGSDMLVFDKTQIPLEMVKIALKTSSDLSLQSVAFDFVIDKSSGKPLIVETSYAFGFDNRETINGYWDEDLIWHDEEFNPFEWMIETIL